MSHRCLSIITQFGCHYTCPYCIVSAQGMNFKRTDETIFPRVIEKLNTGVYDFISLSGGGDPLFNFERNINWYNQLFSIISNQFPNIKVKLHTSYLHLHPRLDLSHIYLIAYHVNFNNKLYPVPAQDYNHIESCCMDRIQRHEGITNRVVFVVEDYFTPELIDSIYEYVQKSDNIDQLTFRQMTDKDYKPTMTCYDYLIDGHEKNKWFYVHGTDFNEYITMNTFETKFQNFCDIEEI